MILVTFNNIAEKSFSESSTLNHQFVIDYPSDWFSRDSEKKFNIDASQSYKILYDLFRIEKVNDISSVTFSSDGKILNITLWLTGAFNDKPKTSTPQYYIRFNTDSDINTGDEWG